MAIKWEKQFINDGMLIFSSENINSIAEMRDAYNERILVFVRGLTEIYGPDSEVTYVASNTTEDILYYIQLIDQLLKTRKGGAEAKKIVTELGATSSRITSGLRKLQTETGKPENRTTLETYEKAMEQDLDDTLVAHQYYVEQFSGIKVSRENLIGDIVKGLGQGEVGETAKSLGLGLATAVLGPFAGMAALAGGAAFDVSRKVGGAIAGAQRKKRAKSLSRALGADTGDMAEIYEKMTQQTRQGEAIGDVFADKSMFRGKGFEGQAPLAVPKRRRVRKPNLGEAFGVPSGAGLGASVGRAVGGQMEAGGVSGKNLQMLAMPLFYFFDKLAFRAKWTKDIYQKLVKKALPDEGSGGFFSAISGGLAALLSTKLLPIIASIGSKIVAGLGFFLQGLMVAAAAKVGWEIGKWIEKKFPAIGDFFEHVVGPKFWAAFDGAIAFMKNAWTNFLKPIYTWQLNALGNIFEFIKMGASGVFKFGKYAWRVIGDRAVAVFDWVKTLFESIAKMFGKAFGGVKDVAESVTQGVTGFATKAAKFFGFNKKEEPPTPQSTGKTVANIPTPKKQTVYEIPVRNDAQMANEVGKLTKSIDKNMQKMVDESKKKTAGYATVSSSSTDVVNLRDPALETFNAGLMVVED